MEKRENLPPNYKKITIKYINKFGRDFIQKKDYPQEIKKILESGEEIKYGEDKKELTKKGIISDNGFSYRLSPISNKDKYSKHYCNCMGIVASGKDKDGVQQSLLTHQDTEKLYRSSHGENFASTLGKHITKFQNRLDNISDIVVFGGNGFFIDNYHKNHLYKDWYLHGVEAISKIVKQTLGYYPTIAHSPKQYGRRNNIYFSTEHNILYIIDTGKPLEYSYRPFTWENIQEMKQLWEATEYKKNRRYDSFYDTSLF